DASFHHGPHVVRGAGRREDQPRLVLGEDAPGGAQPGDDGGFGEGFRHGIRNCTPAMYPGTRQRIGTLHQTGARSCLGSGPRGISAAHASGGCVTRVRWWGTGVVALMLLVLCGGLSLVDGALGSGGRRLAPGTVLSAGTE